MPRIGKRLRAVAGFITPGDRVADIGTDHAALPILLARSGACPRVIETDIAEKPLRFAEHNINAAGLGEKIELRRCDGLEGISPDEADTVVIAGMGGELTAGIIAAADWLKDGRHTLILQPMSRADVLRSFLRGNGFRMTGERAVCDAGRFFTVIRAAFRGDGEEYPPFFEYTGLLAGSLPDPDAAGYLRHAERALNTRADDAVSSGDTGRAAQFRAAAEYIHDLLKQYF